MAKKVIIHDSPNVIYIYIQLFRSLYDLGLGAIVVKTLEKSHRVNTRDGGPLGPWLSHGKYCLSLVPNPRPNSLTHSGH